MIVKQLNEMAMENRQAMNRAMDLSVKFVEHFDKIYNNKNVETASHWASEMQAWLNMILEIKLKGNNKPLSLQQRMDWFFTGGSDSETLFPNNQDEAETYDDFIDNVAINGDVKLSLIIVGLLKRIK